MASLRWKNYSACLALLLERVSCLPSRRPLLPMLPPNPYLQMSDVSPLSFAYVILYGILKPLSQRGPFQVTRTASLKVEGEPRWYGSPPDFDASYRKERRTRPCLRSPGGRREHL